MDMGDICIYIGLALATFFVLSGIVGMLRYQSFIIKTQALCLINVLGNSLLLIISAALCHFSYNSLKIIVILILNIISYLLIVHLLLKKYTNEHVLSTTQTEHHG